MTPGGAQAMAYTDEPRKHKLDRWSPGPGPGQGEVQETRKCRWTAQEEGLPEGCTRHPAFPTCGLWGEFAGLHVRTAALPTSGTHAPQGRGPGWRHPGGGAPLV